MRIPGVVVFSLCMVLGLSVAHSAQKSAAASAPKAKNQTIEGYLRDVDCPYHEPRSGEADTKESKDCLDQCIKAGAVLGILTSDDKIYLPVDKETPPDAGFRQRLIPFAGKYVRVTGEVMMRGGARAIAIQDIQVVENPVKRVKKASDIH